MPFDDPIIEAQADSGDQGPTRPTLWFIFGLLFLVIGAVAMVIDLDLVRKIPIINGLLMMALIPLAFMTMLAVKAMGAVLAITGVILMIIGRFKSR